MQNRIIVILISVIIFIGCGQRVINEESCKGVGFSHKEKSIVAGEELLIGLEAPMPCNTTLLIYGGPYIKEHPISVGVETFDLSYLHMAGTYVLKLLNNKELGGELKLTILPNTGISISDYIGPKTQSFYVEPSVQSSFVIEDSLGNAVNFRNPIEEIVQKNTGYTSNEKVIIHDKYGHIEHELNDEEGYVSLSFNDIKTKRKYIRNETGCAIEGKIKVKESLAYADNDQLIAVKVNNLVDINQNIIEDGTTLQLLLLFNDKELIAKYNSYSIGGEADFILQTPNLAGEYTIELRACGSLISKYKNLKIIAPDIDFTYWSIQNNQVVLEGINVNNAYELSDGKKVAISVTACGNTIIYEVVKRDSKLKISLEDIKILDCSDFEIDIKGIL